MVELFVLKSSILKIVPQRYIADILTTVDKLKHTLEKISVIKFGDSSVHHVWFHFKMADFTFSRSICSLCN